MSSSSHSSRVHSYSIFTHSVGANLAGHSLIDKLNAISDAGFDGIELFQDDLDAFVKSTEFQDILCQYELQQQNLHQYLSVSPPESPWNLDCSLPVESPSRAVSASPPPLTSSHTVSTSSPPLPSSFFPATPSFSFIDKELIVCDRNGQPILGSDNLLMTYNAHGPCTATSYRHELVAASYLSSYCESLNLRIFSLQPLRDFEGWVDPKDQHLAMMRAKSRFQIMQALGTDLLLICSNHQHAPRTTGDFDRIGSDLAALADAANEFGRITVYQGQGHFKRVLCPIRIGFEALSWGAHIDVWANAWKAVEKANRDNVGLILDSFNTLARQYADPCSPTGIIQAPNTYSLLIKSLNELGQLPANKIFFLQIGDARKMEKPLEPSPNERDRPSRMIWSRSNRLFPCEKHLGAFLPVQEFIDAAVKKAGYNGPWSIEVFNSSLNDQNDQVPIQHAHRARQGLDKLVEQLYASTLM